MLGACGDASPTGDPVADEHRLPVVEQLAPAGVGARLWPTPDIRTFRPPTAEEATAVKELVRRIVAHGAALDDPARVWELTPLATRAGFELRLWTVHDRNYLAVLEPVHRRRGGGAYVFRLGPRRYRNELLLQAPHVFFDPGTGAIALGSFLGLGDRARGLFVSNAHRYMHEDGARTRRDFNPADPCVNPAHALAVATEAYVAADPLAWVVQLHGFEESEHGPDAPDAVVGAGDPVASSTVSTAFATALAQSFGDVRRYPEQTRLLGGSTNVQARMLRGHGRARFVDLELSSALRRRLSTEERIHEFAMVLASAADPFEGVSPPLERVPANRRD